MVSSNLKAPIHLFLVLCWFILFSLFFWIFAGFLTAFFRHMLWLLGCTLSLTLYFSLSTFFIRGHIKSSEGEAQRARSTRTRAGANYGSSFPL